MAFPGFAERRVKNDAVMVPDKGFSKQLHALDPELEVVWDWGAEKWEIWRFPRDGKKAFHMVTVQTKDRTYRELGADVLLNLQEFSPDKYTLNELVDYFDEMDNQIQRHKQKDFQNKIKAIIDDTHTWARGVPFAQVPKRFEEIAVPIQGTKQEKVRRAICNA